MFIAKHHHNPTLPIPEGRGKVTEISKVPDLEDRPVQEVTRKSPHFSHVICATGKNGNTGSKVPASLPLIHQQPTSIRFITVPALWGGTARVQTCLSDHLSSPCQVQLQLLHPTNLTCTYFGRASQVPQRSNSFFKCHKSLMQISFQRIVFNCHIRKF